MHVITGRNVNAVWPQALNYLNSGDCVVRTSRNGAVVKAPGPVTTHYVEPKERVLFDAQRDANPFFHLAEALWMIGGRNDVAFVSQFVKRMAEFSDDGLTFHSAYGFRWRQHFDQPEEGPASAGYDQLEAIVEHLRKDPSSRRVVLGIWDPTADLNTLSKDLPCNVSVKFYIEDNRLNMVVFNRSNDIVWGAYGANVVQFSMLQEYLAMQLEVGMGQYWQVSCDWHAYTHVLRDRNLLNGAVPGQTDYYGEVRVMPFPMDSNIPRGLGNGRAIVLARWEEDLHVFLEDPTTHFEQYSTAYFRDCVAPMFYAWRHRNVSQLDPAIDWHRAAGLWLARRGVEVAQSWVDEWHAEDVRGDN